jgi:hypothetical protein
MSDDEPAAQPASENRGDNFYHGTVVSLRRGAQRGVIHTAGGRDVPFVFPFVTMVGPHRRFEDIREGQSVGYDVSWTSKGLRVSVIRIPD